MIARIKTGTVEFQADLSRPHSIAIPMQFGGEQPAAFGVPGATSKPWRDGRFIGDTRAGGPCNFEQVTLVPHCNGTHTECAGHLTNERIGILDSLKNVLMPAQLLSVSPEQLLTENDGGGAGPGIITKSILQAAADSTPEPFREALIVRTLPNRLEKKTQNYAVEPAPWFAEEAAVWLVQFGVQHLLLDLPSIDPAQDEGRLLAHRRFWEMAQSGHDAPAPPARLRTITEMVFVPDTLPDGPYLLNLQVAPFVADAAPSRPVLFKISQGD